ncbi:hypothetical protein CK203_102290 [Vitis vinifera]|uniref:Retrotransposon gag domain-containing protein n=1 Tax=Vitis vinifera TaxID=29760 RepID=A0A438DCB8_VITVI|nr:hypothetical protein CK203_102290 [Vitis vinifera]
MVASTVCRHRERDVHHRHMGCLSREKSRGNLSEDVAYLARKSLKRLKHTGSIREYVKEFSTLMLEIPNMLRRSYCGGDKRSQGHTSKEGSSKGPKGWQGWQKARTSERSSRPDQLLPVRWSALGTDCLRGRLKCYDRGKGARSDAKMDHCSSKCLKAKPMPKTPQSKGLMYVEALVNGKATKAWWIQVPLKHCLGGGGKKVGAPSIQEGGWLKAVNSAAKPSHGVARGVTMHIGSWEGRVDFTVAPMDDFKMVLGMDFLQKVKAVPLPFLLSMAILEEEKPAWSLRSMKEEKDEGSGEPMPREIEGVLDEFKDVMPPSCQETSSRREEDHKIELEPGAKPPAMGHIDGTTRVGGAKETTQGVARCGVHPTIQGSLWRAVLFQKKHEGPYECA